MKKNVFYSHIFLLKQHDTVVKLCWSASQQHEAARRAWLWGVSAVEDTDRPSDWA